MVDRPRLCDTGDTPGTSVVKVRYVLYTQPVCAGCHFPLDTRTTAPCLNCGNHAGVFIPGVVLECDWQHADKVPPEHVLSNIVP